MGGGCYLPKRSSVSPRVAWGTKASRKSVLKLFPPTCWSLTNPLLPSGRWGLCAGSTCLSQQPHTSCPANLVYVPKGIAARQGWNQPGPSAQPEEGAGSGVSLHLMYGSPELGFLPGGPCGKGTKEGQVLDLKDFTPKSRVKAGQSRVKSPRDGQTGLTGRYRFPAGAVGAGSSMS